MLAAYAEVRKRRAQAKQPNRSSPELMADRPNMCWSWDIERHEWCRTRSLSVQASLVVSGVGFTTERPKG